MNVKFLFFIFLTLFTFGVAKSFAIVVQTEPYVVTYCSNESKKDARECALNWCELPRFGCYDCKVISERKIDLGDKDFYWKVWARGCENK